MTVKSIFLAAAVCATFAVGAAERTSLKLLTIGNSFSVSLTSQLPKVAHAMGLDLDYCSIEIGGCSLERHWNNVVAATNVQFKPYSWSRWQKGERVAGGKINLPEAVKLAKWDVISIQQCSHLSWKPESYHPYGDNLVKTLRELAPQAEIVVQETWSYTPWDGRLKKWNITADQMYDRLHAAYVAFAKTYGFRLVPMGAAVQRWRRERPVAYTENSFGGDVCGGHGVAPERRFVKGDDGKWRPKCDVFHLNEDGQYFQALVWTATLFGADVTTCPYDRPGMDAATAAKMRAVVKKECLK